MTVKELISHLQKLNPELEVITASDSEGNSFRGVNYEPSEMWGHPSKYNHWYIAATEDVESGEYDKNELTKVMVID